MKKTILCLFAAWCVVGAGAADRPMIVVGPSETTELMSVIMHLSGAEEYNQRGVWPEYRALVDSVFGDWRGHPVMRIMRDMRKDGYGMAWDRPMILAVNGYIKKGKFVSPYIPIEYEDCWSKEDHVKMISAVSDFYRSTDFHSFYVGQAVPRYASIAESMQRLYNATLDIGWIADFTGDAKGREDYLITLSYLNFYFNYGLTLDKTNSPRPVTSFPGPDGFIITGRIDPYAIDYRSPMLLLHEALHHYQSPLNDEYSDALAPSGEVLYPMVADLLKQHAYTDWPTITNEALTRASEIVYMRTHDFFEDDLPEAVKEEIAMGFWWVERLADLLQEYQLRREKYPTLAEFMPEVVKFYDNLAVEVAGLQK